MPYKDLDEKRRHNREYIARKRLAESERDAKVFGITDEQKQHVEYREERNYPEHQAFSEPHHNRSIEALLNPTPAKKGKSDSPESYHMTGKDITDQNDKDVLSALYPKTKEELEAEAPKNTLEEQVNFQKSLSQPSPRPISEPQSEPQPTQQPQEQKPYSEVERVKQLLSQKKED